MLVGHLDHPETFASLLSHPVWQEAFTWIHKHRVNIPEDHEYLLRDRSLRAIVQSPQLKSRDERQFEAHRREIDLQVCLAGDEVIEWTPAASLTVSEPYNAELDCELFTSPPAATRIVMTPGTCAVFFPGDAHSPGIRHDAEQTRKVVVKINRALLR